MDGRPRYFLMFSVDSRFLVRCLFPFGLHALFPTFPDVSDNHPTIYDESVRLGISDTLMVYLI